MTALKIIGFVAALIGSALVFYRHVADIWQTDVLAALVLTAAQVLSMVAVYEQFFGDEA